MQQNIHVCRTAQATLCIAVGAAVCVYVLNEWFTGTFLPYMGISQPLAAAVGVFLIVLASYLANRIFSVVFYRDMHFGAEESIENLGERRENFIQTADEVSKELRQIRTLNDVLRNQLNSITTETEQAAFDIMSRMTGIDAAVSSLTEEPLVVANIHEASRQLSDMFMNTMASVQFQDVTRQQIEYIASALDHVDEHCTMLAGRLDAFDDPDFTFQPLSVHLDEIYSNYVMQSQRNGHQTAIQAAPGSQSDGPKVELF